MSKQLIVYKKKVGQQSANFAMKWNCQVILKLIFVLISLDYEWRTESSPAE